VEYWKRKALLREKQLGEFLEATSRGVSGEVGSSSSGGLTSRYSESKDEFGQVNVSKFHDLVTENEDAFLRQLIYRRNTRYWLESPSSSKEAVPLYSKFVTFTPWHGGFNNIRMSLEMAAAFAIASNRTLVMPPEQNMYLRGKSSLSSYFDLKDMKAGLSVISYDEFFDLVDFGKYQKERPKNNEVHSNAERYYTGLETMPGVYHTKKIWSKDKIGGNVVYCFPDCPSGKSSLRLSEHQKFEKEWFLKFSRHATPYDGTSPEISNSKIVHFQANLLGHFYTFVYFRDLRQGSHIKKVIRDHIHFVPAIFERAERIISKLGDFQFSCLHIRRNDFQFKETWTTAEDIMKNTKALFDPNEMIYVATDEIDEDKVHFDAGIVAKGKHHNRPAHNWFAPFKNHFGSSNVKFLSDFYDELLVDDTPDILLGCIESVICSRARIFVGTAKSTFSGYIHRLRGYMSDVGQKVILDAQSMYPFDYMDYFKGPAWAHLGHAYQASHPYWGREYKDAWENVNNPLG